MRNVRREQKQKRKKNKCKYARNKKNKKQTMITSLRNKEQRIKKQNHQFPFPETYHDHPSQPWLKVDLVLGYSLLFLPSFHSLPSVGYYHQMPSLSSPNHSLCSCSSNQMRSLNTNLFFIHYFVFVHKTRYIPFFFLLTSFTH